MHFSLMIDKHSLFNVLLVLDEMKFMFKSNLIISLLKILIYFPFSPPIDFSITEINFLLNDIYVCLSFTR